MAIDPTVLAAILGFGGLGVIGFTEMVKRFLKLEDAWVYLISLVISAIITAVVLSTSGAFTVLALAVYTVVVFLEANGIYKAMAKSKTT